MTKVGILLHCRNLTTVKWEELVFGLPEQDKLGDQPTLAKVVMNMPASEDLACIVIGRGPSMRDGLDEGEYSKKFFEDNLGRLSEFPSLRPLIAMRGKKLQGLSEKIVLTSQIANTWHELEEAVRIFKAQGVEKVIQISAASHAPRCLKEQLVARSRGIIDSSQQWTMVATDMAYDGTTPDDICIIEPLHRLDQPLTQVRPGLSEVMKPYFFLPDEDKKEFIELVSGFMANKG